MKKQKDTLTTILIGDTLAELASGLATESGHDIDSESKLIVIMIDDDKLIMAKSGSVSRIEACGALQCAYDITLNG